MAKKKNYRANRELNTNPLYLYILLDMIVHVIDRLLLY
jgi:hypothetical protein